MSLNTTSAKTRLRTWVQERLEEADSIKIPDLTKEAIAIFREDATFMETFIHESLSDVVYDAVRAVVRHNRRRLIHMGDEVVSEAEFGSRARKLAGGWPKWVMRHMEWTGNGHVNVLKMTRSDLLEAAKIREQRGARELGLAAFWKALAERMDPIEPTTVEDTFRPEELEAIRASIKLPVEEE